ncbi:hypothetical protein CPB84DRAFT_1811257 [Gymnopilus junonius]|uniref:Uncharacterized protein n=1 Tax=Gymnopilus junonius TaxID=109634 RepID=A0A9P5N6V4_GYMJU|nr:hypothetical protein CPB84DRAFT_1811257 [Gymnopilus junonius]
MKNGIESPYATSQTNYSSPLSSSILWPTTFPLTMIRRDNVYNTPRKCKVVPSTPAAPLRPNPPATELTPWPRLDIQTYYHRSTS